MQKILGKFQSQITKSQEGVALLWALITIAVLLAITGSMSGLIVKESRMSTGIDSSIKAYAAAESGIEHGSYLVDKGLVSPCQTGGTSCSIEAGVSEYFIDISGPTGNKVVVSTGKSGTTVRKIEKKISTGAESQPFFGLYSSDPGLGDANGGKEHSVTFLDPEPAADPTIKIPISGSYIQSFPINISNNAETFGIGLSDGGSGEIMFSKTSTGIISLTAGSDTISGSAIGTGKYYIEIIYKKASSVQLKITNGLNPGGACVSVLSLPTNENFDLTRVRFESSGGVNWNSPVVSTVNLGTGATVSVMGIWVSELETPATPAVYKPYISSISPSSGLVGTPVTINGIDFGNSPVTVTLRSATASYSTSVTSQNNLGIIFNVPTDAIVGGYDVFVTNGKGESNRVSFTVILPAPTLMSPANGSNNINIPVTFSWNASAGATSYRINVDNNSDFSSLAKDISYASSSGTTHSISGLDYNTTYYWRVNATYTAGTSLWSSFWSFTTLPTPPPTVTIGSQVWMQYNLNVGTMGSTTNPKYCYNNDEDNCTIYGGLYSWNEMMGYVTTQGVQGICPPGFHIPTDAEWSTLTTTVGGDGNALKAIGQGIGAGAGTNTSGFSALLAGYRYTDGSFLNLGSFGYFWTSSETSSSNSWNRALGSSNATVGRGYVNKELGFSVRCLKN